MTSSELIFLDFSDPPANAEGVSVEVTGKFVQLSHESQGDFIIFAPLNKCTFHAQIVELFCKQQSPPWAYEMNSKGDDGTLYEDSATILGGGYLEIHFDKKRLKFSGSSKAFGAYSPFGLNEKMSLLDRFKDYKIFC